MKPKLELKYLAPYFPYHVKAKFKDLNNKKAVEIGTMCIITEAGDITCYDAVNAYPTKFKLLLRPLSWLNDERISDINCDLSDQITIMMLKDKEIGYWNCPYGVIQILLKNHVDIFELIEKGLAEPIKD